MKRSLKTLLITGTTFGAFAIGYITSSTYTRDHYESLLSTQQTQYQEHISQLETQIVEQQVHYESQIIDLKKQFLDGNLPYSVSSPSTEKNTKQESSLSDYLRDSYSAIGKPTASFFDKIPVLNYFLRIKSGLIDLTYNEKPPQPEEEYETETKEQSLKEKIDSKLIGVGDYINSFKPDWWKKIDESIYETITPDSIKESHKEKSYVK